MKARAGSLLPAKKMNALKLMVLAAAFFLCIVPGWSDDILEILENAKDSPGLFLEIFGEKTKTLDLPLTRIFSLVPQIKFDEQQLAIVVDSLEYLFHRYEAGLDNLAIASDIWYQYQSDMARIAVILISYNHEKQEFIRFILNLYHTTLQNPDLYSIEYSNNILVELCAIDDPRLFDITLDIIESRGDLSLKASCLGAMYRSNNPAAIRIARRTISVDSPDFDLYEAELYLKIIIKWGDELDLSFLAELEKEAPRFFHPLDIKELATLINRARDSIRRPLS